MNPLKWLSMVVISLMLMSCGSGSGSSTTTEETFGQSSFGTAKFN
jgi:hypothetical protein